MDWLHITFKDGLTISIHNVEKILMYSGMMIIKYRMNISKVIETQDYPMESIKEFCIK